MEIQFQIKYVGPFVVWATFRKCIHPRGLAKEPSQIDFPSVEYNIGAPDA